jgi:hypothetical protein
MQYADTTSPERPKEKSPPLSAFSLCLLSLVFGAAVMHFHFFPYAFLRSAFIGGQAVYERYVVEATESYYHPSLWSKAPTPETGVTRYDPARAYNGLTLFSSTHAQKATLVDMEGRVVHEWALRFRDVWPDPPHVPSPVDAERIYWRTAHLFPNGDLLAIFAGQGDTPWGYGLVKIDKDSQVIWAYPGRVHHDLDVGPDGRIYTLVHEVETDGLPWLPRLLPPFIHDYVAVLSPGGEELERISLLEAMRDSPYRAMLEDLLFLQLQRTTKGDYTHANAVDVVERPVRGPDVSFAEGQILVSMRDIQAIGVIDPETRAFTWAMRGPWRGQHDPDILDDGRMLIFDNVGHVGPGGRSRVVEFDPFTQEILWQFAGDEREYFFSLLRARQERLPNGNTLITDSAKGRLFEVTRDKRVVWEYWNPQRGGNNDELIAVVTGGQRVSAESLSFLDR